MSTIRIYDRSTPEYKNLARAASLMTDLSPNGYCYFVGETWFDYGQDWRWTTIIARGTMLDGYQALNPSEHEKIVRAASTSELESAVRDVFASKFCPDKP